MLPHPNRRLACDRALVFVLAVACVTTELRADEGDRSGQVLFYRLLGARTQRPLSPRTRTVCSMVGAVKTSTTGMARSGFTEYPFRQGRMDYTCAETWAFFPRFVSGAAVDPDRVNTGDILIDHVYEPDACVWGPSAREFAQTFVASGRELVGFSLLVATRPGRFHAALVAGGPGGATIGSVRTFRSGHSTEWGWARWKAGDAPLEPGRTYAIRIWRADGEPFRPYLHATGDVYADGELFIDGSRAMGSDLGAWIIEEPADVSRAIVEGVDADGWLYGATDVVFRPRTLNVRLVDVTAAPVVEKCRDMVARVWSLDSPPQLLAGPKRNVACARPGTVRRAQFLFAEDELVLEPGTAYRLEVFGIPHKGDIPSPSETARAPLDLRAWIYGETDPGSLPAIHNVRMRFEGKGDLFLSWGITHRAPVRVELGRLTPGESRVFEVEPGTNRLDVPKLWRGHDYDLRLVATGPTGREWRTPVYRFRVPDGPHGPPPPYLYPEHPDVLPEIAPPPVISVRESEPVLFVAEVPIANFDFESELDGWDATPADIVGTSGDAHGISPRSSRHMAGWSRIAGERREQVFEESAISQRVPTTAGNEYLLSAWVHTSVDGGPPGDTRVRLVANRDGTQWYWTAGRWLRFEHRFRATGDAARVGVAFFRWRDLDRASAYVDRVRLWDLGPASQSAGVSASAMDSRVVALDEPRIDAADRAEAWLQAPPGYVVTGLGSRAAGDNITTMRLRVQPLLANGTLGEARVMRGGWELDAGLEANVDLPPGWVATGFGARIAPEWDVKTLAVWGRPLQADGALGEEKEFRAGIQPDGGLEKTVRLDAGRVLTGAGLRCSLNDVKGIRATSARLRPTATGRVE